MFIIYHNIKKSQRTYIYFVLIYHNKIYIKKSKKVKKMNDKSEIEKYNFRIAIIFLITLGCGIFGSILSLLSSFFLIPEIYRPIGTIIFITSILIAVFIKTKFKKEEGEEEKKEEEKEEKERIYKETIKMVFFLMILLNIFIILTAYLFYFMINEINLFTMLIHCLFVIGTIFFIIQYKRKKQTNDLAMIGVITIAVMNFLYFSLMIIYFLGQYGRLN